MTKDRLTTKQTAKALLASLWGATASIDDNIDYILKIAGDPKLKSKKIYIKKELSHLYIYLILKAAETCFFKSLYNEIESHFKEELKQAIENNFSTFFTQLNMADILNAVEDYTIIMNQLLDNTKLDETAITCSFAQHVSKRVLGDDVCDFGCLAYFGLISFQMLEVFREHIKNNIELVPDNESGQGSHCEDTENLNIKNLFYTIIGTKFDDILKSYSWCHKTPAGINGFTNVKIESFEAFAGIGFYSDIKNDIVTNCIISIGQPKDIKKYEEELTLRNEVVSYFDKYYGKNIHLLDSESVMITWDMDDKKVLLYNVSEEGLVSLQLYSKSDSKAQQLLDLIYAKQIDNPINKEIMYQLNEILKILFAIILNIYKNKFPFDEKEKNLQRAGTVLNELVLAQLKDESASFKNNNANFIETEKKRLLEIEEIRKGILNFLIAKGAIMKIWRRTESNMWIDRAKELKPSLDIPVTMDEILKVIKNCLSYYSSF